MQQQARRHQSHAMDVSAVETGDRKQGVLCSVDPGKQQGEHSSKPSLGAV